MTTPEAAGPKTPPSYPPKTPPPPKKPVEAPRPQPVPRPAAALALPRARMRIRNRRTAALTFRADPWAAKKAAAHAVATARTWGYPGLDEQDLAAAVTLLVDATVRDGGKRVSLHLGDQDEKILVIALSHQAGTAPEGGLFGELRALVTLDSCGDDLADDGRRIWALLDAAPRRRPDTAA
ncbi:hypothetical protein OOK31_36685 [Streptomyces sp. NBC_00249]|uniref:hypothetical protein n=1 Tax=Streptomyces sp. NBC_00249 TaxID=2975690 RepID=UPI00225324CE|nr:hypothetical protein [Streptomyces sp. NBC_00249]MCX5199350.1 hypothetical protein [Streptomyces sp. NBC_00249]